MSLIGDALKEAERERARGRTHRASPTHVILVPRSRRRERFRLGLVVFCAALSVGVVAGVLIFRARLGDTVRDVPRSFLSPASSSPGETAIQTTPPVINASSAPSPTTAPLATVPTIPVTSPPAPQQSAPPTRVEAAPAASRIAVAPQTPAHVELAGAPRASAPDAKIVAASPPPQTIPPTVRPATNAASTRPADSLFKQAYAEHLRDNLIAAQELYEQAIATGQAPSSAYNDFGVLLKQQGRPATAAEMFREATARDETNVDAWVNLGDSFDAAGQHADAITAFSRANRLDPARGPVKVRLATAYQAIGDTTTARRNFEDGIKLNPNEPAPHYSFGVFLQSQRDFAGAIREYQLFVDLSGDRYPSRTIADVKEHIAALHKFVP